MPKSIITAVTGKTCRGDYGGFVGIEDNGKVIFYQNNEGKRGKGYFLTYFDLLSVFGTRARNSNIPNFT